MAYRPIEIANEFLAAHGQGGEITHLKLQKLLYFANGWWLAINGEPMVDALPQVWRYGPVFNWIYSVFSKYGNSPITQPEKATPFGGIPPRVPEESREYVTKFIEWIWNLYGNRSAAQLSELTHAGDTPWFKIAARNKFVVGMNTSIPSKDDWEYFVGLATRRGIPVKPLKPQAST